MSAVSERFLAAIRCTEDDIEGLLIHCRGCLQAFRAQCDEERDDDAIVNNAIRDALSARDVHEFACVAARDYRIEEILEIQEADDEARAARQRGEFAP